MATIWDCPWKFLFPESSTPYLHDHPSSHRPSSPSNLLPSSPVLPSPSLPQKKKSFEQALNNACDIPLSQLPVPCLKGDAVAVQIPEDEYLADLERCNNNLQGWILFSNGDSPIKFDDLRSKLVKLWKPIGNWKVVPIGKGFFWVHLLMCGRPSKGSVCGILESWSGCASIIPMVSRH